MIQSRVFGNLKDGTEVELFHIENNRGEYIEVLSFGAVLHKVVVKDKNGVLRDVVLGVDTAEQLEDFNLAGVIVGRCANRVAEARYELDGKIYQLEPGRGGHCLHSGSGNYANRLFSADCVEEENKVIFSLLDDGRGGFGCSVEVRISYTFNDSGQVGITYDMIPDGPTVLAPTNHSYFNLGCEDSRDHLLFIDADTYAVKGEGDVPRGETAIVDGTRMDFRKPRTLREALDADPAAREFDDHLILNGSGWRRVACLYAKETGILMTVRTDMPSLVLFTFAAPREIPGKDGAVYSGFKSVCLETGYVANAVNCPEYASPVHRKGEALHSRTIYEFSAQK